MASINLLLKDPDIAGLGFEKTARGNNPILLRMDGEKAAYLVYDALGRYINGAQKRAYIYPKGCNKEAFEALKEGHYDLARKVDRCEYIDGQYAFMDDITRIFRHGLDGNEKEYPVGIELEDRKSFINHPYLVAVTYGEVAGGVWQEGHYFREHHRKNGARIRKFHIIVANSARGRGIGKELLEAYEAYAHSKGEDGVRCYFDNDNVHEGSEQFFAKMGYEICRGWETVEAVKRFPKARGSQQ